ncbi:EAL domain-containing protein [Catenovulum sp. 2E275]|uniref:GGDEF domain-containing response regulator n=1 Tax=Catenovulum sp. 2E275 TaxID=2980497 RepID=UPI0021CF53B5|nr:GGDEF domain-containing response regulator [Catenovulum sp. 2E275]MCU4675142.1 EAL domain-containing protein [Catenovulum sp. 2E275]
MIILIILKDEIARFKTQDLLEEKGHQVISTSSSVDGISFLKSKYVDFIITEVEIGEIDGWRLSRFVRTGILATDADVPILLVTENHSGRLAETTAQLFDINKVISFHELPLINSIVDLVNIDKANLLVCPSILVIEDTQDTANLIKRILQHRFTVNIAEDGLVGLDAYRHKTYDIVLLDIQLPGLSGEQVLDEIIKINPKQVVIIMTAHGTADLAELVLVKGAADYIQKPFKAEQLRKVCDIAAKREDFLISNQQFLANSNALKAEQQKYDSLAKTHYRVLDNLTSIVMELTPTGRISFLNNAWQSKTGFLVSESIGKYFVDFIDKSHSHLISYIEESIQSLLNKQTNNNSIELKLKHKHHVHFWCEINLAPYYDENNKLAGIAGSIDDISIRKKAEDNLKHLALHDTLTGLHNRYYFDNELKKVSNIAFHSKQSFPLLYIDLDHFKVINDTQGHNQGDLVLKEIGKLLAESVTSKDILCRIGGDEFALLLADTSLMEAESIANQFCNAIANTSFQFEDKIYKVSCSIGIADINGQFPDSDLYLQRADIAMYAAKEKGRNRVHVFQDNDQITDALKQSFDWVQKVQSALIADQLIMHFQPVLDLKTNRIAYFEALVRLIIDNQIVYPGQFIPPLEKAKDMDLLDRHVVGKTIYMMKQYPELKCVAINLSAQAFTDDKFLEYVEEKLTYYQIEPSRIIFELTESASLSNITGTQRIVNKLNQLGCSFSIDDFGTGFSTFTYLKQLPAQSVKIDGSFVKDMEHDPIDATLVKAIHDTAVALNKKTVAEFVENAEILNKLRRIGVHYAQGFYIAKPMDIKALIDQLAEKENI